MWMMSSVSSPEVRDIVLNFLNSIDPHIKFTVELPNMDGAIPFLDTFPHPKGNRICVSIYIGNQPIQIGTWTSTPVTIYWLKELW